MSTEKAASGRIAEEQAEDFVSLSALWWVWLLSAVAVFALVGGESGAATLVTGWLLVITGIHLFLEHGGPRISGPGLVGISHTVFLGAPALYWLNEEPAGLGPGLGFLLAFEYAAFVAMTVLFWRRWRQPKIPRPERIDSRLIVAAIVSFLAAVALNLAGTGLVQFAVGVTALMLIVIMLPISSFSFNSTVRVLSALGVVAVFVGVVFTGRGRLVLVALVLSCAVVWSSYLTTRVVKWFCVAVLPVVTSALVMIREKGINETDEGSDGLGSVVNPLRDFQAVRDWIDAGGSYGGGETFVATFTVWIPRSVWEGKPVGFGRRLTEMLMPELLETNQSLAALSAGEWYYNWGLWGLVAMAIGIGIFVAVMERAYVNALMGSGASARSIVKLSILGVLIGGLPTLIWVGSFTFVERALQAVVPLVLVWVLVPAEPSHSRPQRR